MAKNSKRNRHTGRINAMVRGMMDNPKARIVESSTGSKYRYIPGQPMVRVQ